MATGNDTGNASTDAACAGKGPIQGGICRVIENKKRGILKGALTKTQGLTRGTLALILRRPAPRRDGEIAVFRPPTNQPPAGAYQGWAMVGLPLGFMVWILGAGVALMSRFRPSARFAAQGFQIEENLFRNLVLVIGSWWVGAFVLHMANGVILAAAPHGDQLITGPQTGVGNILATGGLVGLIWAATGAIVTILFLAIILSYFLCLVLLQFLPVFSAFLLFDAGGVLRTIGGFGQTGWDIFIRTAFFPLPAAFALGAGSFIAGGTMGYVEEAIAIGGIAGVAGTLAFAIVMFITQLTALGISLWMLLGSRATSFAGGVIAGLGGAAMYSRAKAKMGQLAEKVPLLGGGSGGGGATAVATGAGVRTDPLADSPISRDGASGSSDALGAGGPTDKSNALGAGSPEDNAGGIPPAGVPTGGRSRPTGITRSSITGDSTGLSAVGAADTVGGGDTIVVEQDHDLPPGQDYQPGYISDGEFQSVITSHGRNREMLVREHDRFSQAYDSEGDHPGIYLRGEDDGRLYDASPVAGEDWGMNPREEAGLSRDAVYDARNGGGESR